MCVFQGSFRKKLASFRLFWDPKLFLSLEEGMAFEQHKKTRETSLVRLTQETTFDLSYDLKTNLSKA